MIKNEKKEAFIDAFLDGQAIASTDEQLRRLTGMVYDLRIKVKTRDTIMEDMDEIARDNGWTVKCRSCGETYSPDIELSEYSHEGNYCGKSEFCCP